MRKYIVAVFNSGRTTTTGEPNAFTGRFSVACNLYKFKSYIEAERCINRFNDNETLIDIITKTDARNLCLGMTQVEFDEYYNNGLDNVFDGFIMED